MRVIKSTSKGNAIVSSLKECEQRKRVAVATSPNAKMQRGERGEDVKLAKGAALLNVKAATDWSRGANVAATTTSGVASDRGGPMHVCATDARVPRHRSIPRSSFSTVWSLSASFALLTSTLKCFPTRLLGVGTRRISITSCHANCQTSTISSTFTGTQLQSCSKHALHFS
jgi:hypothetical protein